MNLLLAVSRRPQPLVLPGRVARVAVVSLIHVLAVIFTHKLSVGLSPTPRQSIPACIPAGQMETSPPCLLSLVLLKELYKEKAHIEIHAMVSGDGSGVWFFWRGTGLKCWF